MWYLICMVTLLVIYRENGLVDTVTIAAADEQTALTALNQWRVNERRISGRIITVLETKII